MRIRTDLVKLFTSITVVDVSPVVIADAVILWAIQVGRRDVFPVRLRIFEQRYKTRSLGLVDIGDATQLCQRRKQAKQVYRLVAFRASCGSSCQAGGTLGGSNDERNPRADSPTSEFLPVLLFAQVPAVITPKNDNRIINVGP